MKPSPSNQLIIYPLGIKDTMKWSIYHRLQELEIFCTCSTNKLLKVQRDRATMFCLQAFHCIW